MQREGEKMKILESPLLEEFIAFLKANWGDNSRVNQRRRRLRQLVAMVRGVADAAEGRTALRGGSLNAWLQLLRKEALRGQAVLDATSDASAVVGSARKFLAGIKTLFVCSAEVDRLTEAVEELERLASPGGDLDLFVKVLQLDAASAAAMDVDAQVTTATYVEQGNSWANSVAAELPVPGVKRKRAGSSGVDQAGNVGDSTSHGRLDRVGQQKRRVLAWMRPPSFGGVFAASSREPLAPPGSFRARTVAMAITRVRRRIGKPTRRRRRPGSPSLGRRLSRISL